ncbi:MAG: hypothetical protein EG823_02120 [Actinobacteria bacterium]|nr:hypothetical protein [Actinomycetota bacterium]
MMCIRIAPWIAGACLIPGLLGAPVPAAALELRMPVEGGAIILPFGASSPGGTHRGVDVSAVGGDTVTAPVGGTVTFAGSVPADGGGTCIAVTIETAEGRRVSLVPLEGATVVVGEYIEAGSAIGVVREAGDDSSGEPHVHVSLRQGDLYLDPGPLLAAGCDGGGTSAPVPEVESAAPELPIGGAGARAAAGYTCAATPLAATSPGTRPAAASEPGAPASAAGIEVARAAHRPVEGASVPVQSALDPTARYAVVRPRVRASALSPRAVSSGLALAVMCLSLAGIAVTRRAVSVVSE